MPQLDSIYTENNKYGFKININHLRVRDLYIRYKRWKNIPYNVPLSDDERFEFESYMSQKKGVFKDDIPTSDTLHP